MKSKIIITLLLYLIWQMPLSACTIFSIKQDENVYVGNNEDWYNPNSRYRVFPRSEGRYGRIVFSFENNWAQGGMNEKGLFFDEILRPEESATWKKDPTKKDYVGNLSDKILAVSYTHLTLPTICSV